MTPVPVADRCPVCTAPRSVDFTATVLGKHDVSYVFCALCGLLQTEPPFWLEEAYSAPIARADTGLIQRNIAVADRLSLVLYSFFDSKRDQFLDAAGGYGALTRLMRDFGFDYYWSDPYAENLLAPGFEAEPSRTRYAAVSAIEVLEHVTDPVAFIDETLSAAGSDTLFFTTELFLGEPPPRDWWYYTFGTGQHVSFYQRRTLEHIADRLGLRAHVGSMLHVLTRRDFDHRLLRLLTSRAASLGGRYVRRRLTSKTFPDHYALLDQALTQPVRRIQKLPGMDDSTE